MNQQEKAPVLVPFTFWSPERTARYLNKECEFYAELVAAEEKSNGSCSSEILCRDESHAAEIAKAIYNETDVTLKYHRTIFGHVWLATYNRSLYSSAEIAFQNGALINTGVSLRFMQQDEDSADVDLVSNTLSLAVSAIGSEQKNMVICLVSGLRDATVADQQLDPSILALELDIREHHQSWLCFVYKSTLLNARRKFIKNPDLIGESGNFRRETTGVSEESLSVGA